MRKKILSFLLAVSMIMSVSIVTMAAELTEDKGTSAVESMDANSGSVCVEGACLVAEEAIARDNMNAEILSVCEQEEDGEENCGSVVIGFSSKDEEVIGAANADLLLENSVRATTKPSLYWNIAKNGIYNGEFSAVAGTIYTNYYFDFDEDPAGDSDYCYYTRVNVTTHQYANQSTFKIQNYCTECGLVSSTDEYTTPGEFEETGYIYIKHYFSTKHDGHFMYPAVVNTTSYGKIDGTIDVNYTNTWR